MSDDSTHDDEPAAREWIARLSWSPTRNTNCPTNKNGVTFRDWWHQANAAAIERLHDGNSWYYAWQAGRSPDEPYSLEDLAKRDPQYLVQTIREQAARIAELEAVIAEAVTMNDKILARIDELEGRCTLEESGRLAMMVDERDARIAELEAQPLLDEIQDVTRALGVLPGQQWHSEALKRIDRWHREIEDMKDELIQARAEGR